MHNRMSVFSIMATLILSARVYGGGGSPVASMQYYPRFGVPGTQQQGGTSVGFNAKWPYSYDSDDPDAEWRIVEWDWIWPAEAVDIWEGEGTYLGLAHCYFPDSGIYTVKVRVKDNDGNWSDEFPCAVYMVEVDIDIDGVIDDDEEYPGGSLVVNCDDDDNSGTADKDDPGTVAGEDNLAIVWLDFQPSNLDVGNLVLEVYYGSTAVPVWTGPQRGNRILPNGRYDSWEYSYGPLNAPSDVYAEGASSSAGTWISWKFQPTSEDVTLCEDLVRFVVDDVSLDSMSANTNTADLCEEVTFSITTTPAGTGTDLVVWSGGDCPETQNGGSAFKTKWSCIGSKTVTASLCGNSLSEQVSVQLPDGCTEAAWHDQTITWTDYEDLHYDGGVPCPVLPSYGCFDPPDDALEYDVEFAYDSCKWVCEISCPTTATYLNVTDPESIGSKISVDSTDDIDCSDYPAANNDLRDPDPDDDEGPPNFGTPWWSHTGITEHEKKHRTDWKMYYEQALADAISYCETGTETEIDCADENTHSCQDLLSYYEDAIDAVLAGAWGEAYSMMDNPDTSLLESEVRAWKAYSNFINDILDEVEANCGL